MLARVNTKTMMDMEIPLKTSIRFVGILWENDIEVLEMNTDKSKEYEDKWNKNLLPAKESMDGLQILHISICIPLHC